MAPGMMERGASTAYTLPLAELQRPQDGTDPGGARATRDEWGRFVRRSNIEDKELWKWPESDRRAKGGCLLTNGSYEPASGQAKFKSLKNLKADEGPSRGQSSAGRLWKMYFRDPTAWWDNRNDKLHLKSPDFRHKVTNDALWVDKPSTPRWVTEALESRILSKKAGGRCVECFFSSDSVSGLDEFHWTALISQHIRCGQHRQALQTYEEMIESGTKPSSYTFVAALKACSSLQDLETTMHIHCDVGKSGFESNIFVENMLVDVYAKCGHVTGARHVFERIPRRNVFSWNAMILGYTQIGQVEEALHLYKRMQQEGVSPDGQTFVAVLKGCSAQHNRADTKRVTRQWLQEIRVLHSDILKAGSVLDIYVGNMLVYVYAKCGSLPDSRHVFDNMRHRNVVSWTAMIMGYVQMEEGEVALQLYAQMQQEGVRPNARTFVGALKACSSLAPSDQMKEADGIAVFNKRCLEQVRAIHRDIVNSGFEQDVFVGTMLVDVYAKCGSLLEARCVFNEMPRRNVVSWTAMILGCAQMERGEEALHLYAQMQQEGVVPNDRTFLGALKACSSLASSHEGNEVAGALVRKRCLDQVRAIHAQVMKSGSYLDVFVGTMLVDVYAKCGSLVDARQVFERMPRRDAVSWNAMIMGYSQMEKGEEALQLYARMQHEGVVPDERTFMGALKACGSVAGLEKGKQIHAQISKTGLAVTDSFVASSLIDMYAKCGSMADAQQVFDALRKRDIVTWSALISGYARQGESALVFDLFERMRKQGVKPNGVTFLSLLSVCSHVGLVAKGQKYFESMSRDFGITPSINHYTCMVDLLGRVGQLDRAMAVVNSMPFAPDGPVWEAVLGGCRKWNNVELGRKAFECALRLDETDAAPYVLMSNIYAAAHMWKEAKEVQALRVKTGARKRPGQSWCTDPGGVVHAFGAPDRQNADTTTQAMVQFDSNS